MKVAEYYEVLESVAVEIDPALDGFEGVLFELVFDGERHVLAEQGIGLRKRDVAYILQYFRAFAFLASARVPEVPRPSSAPASGAASMPPVVSLRRAPHTIRAEAGYMSEPRAGACVFSVGSRTRAYDWEIEADPGELLYHGVS